MLILKVSKCYVEKFYLASLTGLDMLSLAGKCVFYRPEHNEKGSPHGTELWRSWNEKIYQWLELTVDGKNGVICVVIMLTLRVIPIKVSKDGSVLYFLLIATKISHILGKIYWVLSENDCCALELNSLLRLEVSKKLTVKKLL